MVEFELSQDYFWEQAWIQRELERIYAGREDKPEATLRTELESMARQTQIITLDRHWLADRARDFARGVPPLKLEPGT
jgi:hypothetical protein